jgi:hypothetical protein
MNKITIAANANNNLGIAPVVIKTHELEDKDCALTLSYEEDGDQYIDYELNEQQVFELIAALSKIVANHKCVNFNKNDAGELHCSVCNEQLQQNFLPSIYNY